MESTLFTLSTSNLVQFSRSCRFKTSEGEWEYLIGTFNSPAGIPVPTVAIGKPGAINAALAAISILGNKYPEIEKKLENFRIKQTKSIKKIPIDEQ